MTSRIFLAILVLFFAKPGRADSDERRDEILRWRQKMSELQGKGQWLLDGVDTAKHVAETGLFAAMHAKEVCSCYFVTKLDKRTCTALANVYVSRFVVHTAISDDEGWVKSVQLITLPLLPTPNERRIRRYFIARFDKRNPRLGCHLVERGDEPVPESGRP